MDAHDRVPPQADALADLDVELAYALDPARLFRDCADELDLKTLLLENSLDGILAHTAEGRIVYCNTTAHRQLGFSREEFEALPPWGWIAESMRSSVDERLEVIRERGSLMFASQGVSADGHTVHTEVHCALVRTPVGELVVSVIRDVTDRVRSDAELRHLAYHDRLTGLANRAKFDDDVVCALAAAKRHGDCVGVVYLDLDDFKPVNDELGHAAGDEVLRIVAERLGDAVRECDTVARLGGDEFVALVQRLSGPGDLAMIAHKLASAVEQPIRLHDHSVGVTASAGMALYEEGELPSDLIARADRSMYRAKQEGLSGWEAFLHEQHAP